MSAIIFLHYPQKVFFFLFSDSCFFPWGLECCWFRLMHVTGIVNWNEGWLHANKSTLLTPCFTHSSSSKWLMEWLEGRFVDAWNRPLLLSGSGESSRKASAYIHISLFCLKYLLCTLCCSLALFNIFTLSCSCFSFRYLFFFYLSITFKFSCYFPVCADI